MDKKTDVIIVGAGIAGLTTAIELLDSSLKITLLDRNGPDRLGGLAKDSFGGIFFVDSPQQKRMGIADSAELALADWKRFGELDPEDEMAVAWAEYYVNHCTEKVYFWLKEKGVSFFPVVHWVERGLYQPGNSVPRFHMVWGTGYALVQSLVQRLKAHPNFGNLEIKFNHRVDGFESAGGKPGGVYGMNESDQIPFRVLADRIVIGTGGLGGSLNQVKKHWYWKKVPENMLIGTHPSADGAMHEALSALGGKVAGLNKMWMYAAGVHHPRPSFPDHGLSLVPPKSALWMNASGQRIGSPPLVSGFDTRYLVEQVTHQEKSHTWQVLNWKIAVKELAVSGSEFNESMRDKKIFKFLKTILFGNPDLVRDLTQNSEDFLLADSLGELVMKMNELAPDAEVDLEKMRDEIQRYDQQIARGKKYFNDDQLRRIAHLRRYRGDRVRTSKFQAILDPSAGPLIAIRLFPVTRKTLGGVQTDLKSRVLAMDGKPIPGLYAVGETAGFGGGGSHGIRALEGTFLGTCILTGRAAAESILEEK